MDTLKVEKIPYTQSIVTPKLLQRGINVYNILFLVTFNNPQTHSTYPRLRTFDFLWIIFKTE